MKLTVHSSSPEETRALGARLGAAARPGEVFLLEGPLGAGKTLLVQGMATGVGAEEGASSPTFVLVHEYRGRLTLVHADLYRVESRREVEELGLLDLSEDGVLVMEWADRAPWLRDRASAVITFEPEGERVRSISIDTEAPHLRSAVEAAA